MNNLISKPIQQSNCEYQVLIKDLEYPAYQCMTEKQYNYVINQEKIENHGSFISLIYSLLIISGVSIIFAIVYYTK